jgi:hypothetical protein
MWDLIRSRLESEFRSHPAVGAELAATIEAVAAGRDAPPVAARRLLGLFRGDAAPGATQLKPRASP